MGAGSEELHNRGKELILSSPVLVLLNESCQERGKVVSQNFADYGRVEGSDPIDPRTIRASRLRFVRASGEDRPSQCLRVARCFCEKACFSNSGLSGNQDHTAVMTPRLLQRFMELPSFLISPNEFTIFQGGGSVNFAAPIPEPETYARMLAGLGVVAFVARRRRPR